MSTTRLTSSMRVALTCTLCWLWLALPARGADFMAAVPSTNNATSAGMRLVLLAPDGQWTWGIPVSLLMSNQIFSGAITHARENTNVWSSTDNPYYEQFAWRGASARDIWQFYSATNFFGWRDLEGGGTPLGIQKGMDPGWYLFGGDYGWRFRGPVNIGGTLRIVSLADTNLVIAEIGTNGIVMTNGPVTINNLVTETITIGTNVAVSGGVAATNLAALLRSSGTNDSAFVMGYRTPGDGGGGQFRYDPTSSAATNYGTVFAHSSGTGRWLRVMHGDDIYLEAFGANADVADNAPLIQDAVNWWIYSTSQRKGKLRMRNQSLDIASPIIIARTNSAGDAFERLFGLTIEADTPTGTRNSTSAEWVQTATNHAAVILQYCDSMVFRNLNLRGQNTYVTEGRVNTATERLYDTNFLSAANAIRTNHDSPHAGFIVDCFSDNASLSNNQYADLEHFYIGDTGGSANIRWENCKVYDFYVSWLLNPNPEGTIQQGDGMLLDNCVMAGNTYSVVVGQSQSRAVLLNHCHQNFSKVAITTKGFGQSSGAPPVIHAGQYGNSKYWFDVDTTTGELSVTAAYSEALGSIGWIAGTITGNSLPASFKDTKFGFTEFTTVRPDFYGFFAYVKFDGCQFTANGDETMNFVNGQNTSSSVGSVHFVNCRFQSEAPALATMTFTAMRNVRFENSFVYDPSVSGGVLAGLMSESVKTRAAADYNRHFLPFGATIAIGGTNYFTAYDETPEVEAGLTTFSFNGDGTGEGFASSATTALLLRSNDVVVSRAVHGQHEADGDGENSTAGGRYVGRVALQETNWFSLVDVPPYWTNQTVSSATIRRFRRFHEPTTGDLTSGSATIANFSATNAWAVGDQIRGSGITPGTTIITNDGTTVVMSRLATATATGVSLYDARYFRTATHSELTSASSNSVVVAAGTGGITVTPSGSGGVMTYTIDDDDAGGAGIGDMVAAEDGAAITNYIALASSNSVVVAAGTGGITVTPSGSGGVMTYTIDDDDAGAGAASTNFVVTAHGDLTVTNQISILAAAVEPSSAVTNFTLDFAFARRTVTMTNHAHLSAIDNEGSVTAPKAAVWRFKNFSGGALTVSMEEGFRPLGVTSMSVPNGEELFLYADNDGPDLTNTAVNLALSDGTGALADWHVERTQSNIYTIHKPAARVNVSPGEPLIYITNSFATTNSIIVSGKNEFVEPDNPFNIRCLQNGLMEIIFSVAPGSGTNEISWLIVNPGE